MDSNRFEAATRMLGRVASRRGALPAALSGTLGLLGTTEAKKHKKKHRCKKCKKDKPFCAGKNYCEDLSQCGDMIECQCYVTADGAPFCGASVQGTSCLDCSPAETCVNLNGSQCGVAEACATPCPNPL